MMLAPHRQFRDDGDAVTTTTTTPTTPVDTGPINSRRLVTPGAATWERQVRPGADDRYLVITVDSHASEPADVYELGGIDPAYRPRLPHMVVDDEGRHLMVIDGWDRPQLVKGRPKNTEYEAQWEREGLDSSLQMWSDRMEPDDLRRMQASSTKYADEPSLQRMSEDMSADGVDGAVVFANRGMVCFATYDAQFAAAMTHAWNVWAWETYKDHRQRFAISAQLSTEDVDLALRELEWIAATGFRAVNIPCKPLFGERGADDIHYNHPRFDRLWAAIEETGIALCMHVATGRDPRAATGSGGAIINKAAGFLQGTMEPLANLLASGIFERHPRLRFMTVEADIGWVPWLLESLDHAYYKHHMWVRPWLNEPPSHYYRSNCAASFIEDRAGLLLAREFNLVDNFLWSNDYPHHEGTWPHSPYAIERGLQGFTDEERAKLLGLNAARIFGFDADALIASRSA
jgi:predicted TIM-barrel fold metal-dependent hydrolase